MWAPRRCWRHALSCDPFHETVFRPINSQLAHLPVFSMANSATTHVGPTLRSSGMRQNNMSRVREHHHAAGALRRTHLNPHRHPLLLDPDGERIQLQATKHALNTRIAEPVILVIISIHNVSDLRESRSPNCSQNTVCYRVREIK
ncbi:hypothetical protein OPV22_027049 [Ensete ventricosum]|uniref:Uncharacterized protein n=1 Tax=Ensete ventricosum TaxID=4639 RepID=A0AAV8PUL9_ENSVE|nr:hypothetical protein OPV22_027049 [Ensete ventricosum]